MFNSYFKQNYFVISARTYEISEVLDPSGKADKKKNKNKNGGSMLGCQVRFSVASDIFPYSYCSFCS